MHCSSTRVVIPPEEIVGVVNCNPRTILDMLFSYPDQLYLSLWVELDMYGKVIIFRPTTVPSPEEADEKEEEEEAVTDGRSAHW